LVFTKEDKRKLKKFGLRLEKAKRNFTKNLSRRSTNVWHELWKKEKEEDARRRKN
jgi:hypothetical protein